MADEEYGRQIPFAFLERIQAEWKEKLADKARSATAHSLDNTFGCAKMSACCRLCYTGVQSHVMSMRLWRDLSLTAARSNSSS